MTTEMENCFEIGYWLHQKHCGKGFTTECVQRLIMFARDELHASSLCMYINENNTGSLRIAEKTGFHLVEKRLEHVLELRPEWKDYVNHYLELNLS